jgi:hypothetical protein
MANEKPLMNQIGEGIKNALGVDTRPEGVVVPKLTKVPTVKIPQTPEQKKAAYEKRKQRIALNNRFKRFEANERKLNAGVSRLSTVNRAIGVNKHAINQLRKELVAQKRYAAMLQKKWEQKNAVALKKMSMTLRNQLRKEQAIKFNAFAKQQMAKRNADQLSKQRAMAARRKLAAKKKALALRKRQALLEQRRRAALFASRKRRGITYRGRQSSLKRSIVRKSIVRKPTVRRPIVRRPVPVRRPIARKPLVRKPVAIRRPGCQETYCKKTDCPQARDQKANCLSSPYA